MNERRYAESQDFFKDSLRVLKAGGQDKTLGYLFILKRLAYATFKDHKYSESEKYFKVCNDLCSVVTNNPANLFSAQKNLLIFYTHTNLDQALSLGNRMLKDVEQTVPMALKELYFLIGVIFTS